MRVYYFGPWDRAGHFFCGANGRHVYGKEEDSIPWSPGEIDGKLQPHDTPDCRGIEYGYCGCGSGPEGVALLHHKNGWTALSFWDRSVDQRGGCNSTFIVEGDFGFEEMVAIAKKEFAERWARMKFEVRLHESVKTEGGRSDEGMR